MSDDLTRFENWAAPLIGALSDGERLRLARDIGQKLKRSQSARIASQMNPDGSPFEARKPQALRNKKGKIRREMFNKMRAARFLKAQTTANEVAIGFVGRVARIARVHQFGERDQVQPGGPEYQYPERRLLGFSAEDEDMIRDSIMAHLECIVKK